MRDMAAGATGMIDFCSALYLGLRHAAAVLPPWQALTLGKPAALEELPAAEELASALARLQGCASATLLPSTLHLFWDLFGMLATQPLAVLVDGGAYPIARWGAQHGAACGLPVQVFASGAAGHALRLARRWRRLGRRPLILADGYRPGADQPPPLADYADIAEAGGGYLLIDDTQVLGVSGSCGGGSVSVHGLAGAPVVIGASLAKAFGAPLAVLAGSRRMVEQFERGSQVRRHASPPSAADVAAGLRALRINRERGDALRRDLERRVRQWRAGLAALGVEGHGGGFPVQTVTLPGVADALALHAALADDGIAAVPQQLGRRAALSFLLRADHRPHDIDRALAALALHLRRLYVSVI